MARHKPKKIKIAKNWGSDAATRKQKLVAAIAAKKAAAASGASTPTSDAGGASAAQGTTTGVHKDQYGTDISGLQSLDPNGTWKTKTSDVGEANQGTGQVFSLSEGGMNAMGLYKTPSKTDPAGYIYTTRKPGAPRPPRRPNRPRYPGR